MSEALKEPADLEGGPRGSEPGLACTALRRESHRTRPRHAGASAAAHSAPHRMRQRARGHTPTPPSPPGTAAEREQLLLKIPRGKLEPWAAAPGDATLARTSAALRLGNPVGAAWRSMVASMITCCPRWTTARGDRRPWLEHLEDA